MTNPFSLIQSKEIYKNPWIRVREDMVLRPGGSEGIFGVVSMCKGATVVPVTDDNMIYLTEEYKYAYKNVSIEVISGAIDEGETPLDAAKRELQEEAGLTASKWTDLKAVHPFTTVIDSENNVFMAEVLSETDRCLDNGEVVDIKKIKLTEAVDMVMQGSIVHSASCVAILKAARLKGV